MRRFSVAVVAVYALLLLAACVATSPLPSPFQNSDFPASAKHKLLSKVGSSGPFSVVQADVAPTSQFPFVAAEITNNISYDALGWDFVQVTASPSLLTASDHGAGAYYCAGYLEGYVTLVRIGQVFIANNITYGSQILTWVEQHIAYMNTSAILNAQQGYPSPFWTQVGNQLRQMQGIADGYAQALIDTNAQNQPTLHFIDIFMLNFNNELPDLQSIYPNSTSSATAMMTDTGIDGLLPFKTANLHCSALVKVTSDDVFFSHVTWGGYNTMVRQYKVYVFQSTVSMSSVAGTIASGDDWYITSFNMSVQETTNDYYNMSLLQYIVPTTVSEFMRVMVANFVATSGPQWVELFAYNNSGTYCNQYMVLDYKLYTPGDQGAALKTNLLWVAEQIPGLVMSADVTENLRRDSYWASFNIPYFPYIYNISGFLQLYEQFGDVFSYTMYARPEIFKRNETLVTDLVTMRAIMRLNNWQVDPLSVIPNCSYCNPQGNPWLAISSRGDLVNDSWTFPKNVAYASQFYQGNQGGIDSKIASYSMLQQGVMGNVICGPTYDQQPVFVYDVAFPGQRPPGSANVFDFPWVFFNVVPSGNSTAPTTTTTTAPTNFTTTTTAPANSTTAPTTSTTVAPQASTPPSSSRGVVIGVSIGVPVALVVIALVVYRHRRQQALRESAAYVQM